MIEIARQSIGTPFRLWGSDLSRGVDCFTIIALSAEQAGLKPDELWKLWATQDIRKSPVNALETDLIQIPISEATTGNLLVSTTFTVHLGLITGIQPFKSYRSQFDSVRASR